MAEISKIQLINGESYQFRDRHYVVCNSAAGSPIKNVTIDNLEIAEGAQLCVKFSNTNTVENPVLSINGGTSRPLVMYTGTPVGIVPTESWNAGAVVELVFDGSSWVVQGLAGFLKLGFYLDEDGDLCQVD